MSTCVAVWQAHVYLEYQPGTSLTVTANDDIWVFINGEVLCVGAVRLVAAHTATLLEHPHSSDPIIDLRTRPPSPSMPL